MAVNSTAKLDREIHLTDPVVEGGAYVHEVTGESGYIMGITTDPRSGKVSGNLYTFRRGNLPSIVTENSPTMEKWKLVRAGSDKTANGLVGAHRKKYASKE